MRINSTYIRYFKHIASLCCFVFLPLTIIMPAQSAPKTVLEAPPVDTSSMPDSISRLIQNIFSLIDSLEVKDSTRIDIHVDTTRLVKDTIFIMTEFVEDSIMAQSVQQLDSIVEKKSWPIFRFKNRQYTSQTARQRYLAKNSAETATAENVRTSTSHFARGKNKFTIIPTREIGQSDLHAYYFQRATTGNTPALCENVLKKEYVPYTICRRKNSIDKARSLAELGAYAQATAIIAHPEKVRYTPERLPKAIHLERMKKRREILTVKGPSTPRKFDIKGRPVKLKHWISSLQSALQISQIYISDNWYQGGTSNINLISTQAYSIKYNDYNDKILFENKIQWNLNISSAPDDTLRNYSISEDLFRIDSKFDYKAFKNFYYSTSLYFKTQFFNNYKKNTETRTASFLSPGELSYNLGMSHNYTSKNKSFTSSVSVSPFSYNLKACIDEEMDPTKFGIEKEKKMLHKFGSSFDTNIKWQFMRNMYLSSRLYYFTSYKHVQIDFENTFNFVLNRYFSTRIEFKMRYDDSADPNEKGSFIQIKEMLSFGLFFRI